MHKMVLIHYLGDESIAEHFPHRNSQHNKIYYRTYPSVISKVATAHDLPGNVYKKAISTSSCSGQHHPHAMPRNSQQVLNAQHKERQRFRLTHDGIYNLHELAYDLGSFVKTITTYPDLVLVCGLDEFTQELDMLLELASEKPQLLSYDTTFQLGDFYVSPLLFRHTMFTESPVIPAMFLVHECKFQKAHEQFMQHVAEFVPSLIKGKRMIPLVTDGEVGIYKVCLEIFPLLLMVE